MKLRLLVLLLVLTGCSRGMVRGGVLTMSLADMIGLPPLGAERAPVQGEAVYDRNTRRTRASGTTAQTSSRQTQARTQSRPVEQPQNPPDLKKIEESIAQELARRHPADTSATTPASTKEGTVPEGLPALGSPAIDSGDAEGEDPVKVNQPPPPKQAPKEDLPAF